MGNPIPPANDICEHCGEPIFMPEMAVFCSMGRCVSDNENLYDSDMAAKVIRRVLGSDGKRADVELYRVPMALSARVHACPVCDCIFRLWRAQ